jgi:hypothetical protein
MTTRVGFSISGAADAPVLGDGELVDGEPVIVLRVVEVEHARRRAGTYSTQSSPSRSIDTAGTRHCIVTVSVSHSGS